MTNQHHTPYCRLFISYSHKDASYREEMETAIALLVRDKGVQMWSDRDILAGQNLSSEIQERMDYANVFVFLLSPDSIASQYCGQEWKYAAKLEKEGKKIFRIPIILRPCAWQDFMGDDNIKALPNDGKSISEFESEDVGWKQTYDGIKAVIEHIAQAHTPRRDFIKALNKTEFLSQSHIKLQDLFIFPRLTCQDPQIREQISQDNIIGNLEGLWANKKALVHGPQNSGKTALMRHLFLSLVEQREPVIYIDGNELSGKSHDTIVREAYSVQFEGDYDTWQWQNQKTLIFDNFSDSTRCLRFLANAKDEFDRIYLGVSTEAYFAFFLDEERLVGFRPMRIETLTLAQQERLIRERAKLADPPIPDIDSYVDRLEREVNSVVVSERIFPRYPFYVLSILQSHETYMPDNLSVTSYGYCYYALIVANLVQAGISHSDDSVGAAFNFAEHLAFEAYKHEEQELSAEFDFEAFEANYNERFAIPSSIVNRLKHRHYGLIDDQGNFRTKYMYYYFLGKYLSRGTKETRAIIKEMCEHSYRESHHLTLLFVIHHTDDSTIIDNILVRTMCSVDEVKPAKLDNEETKRFAAIVAGMPENILTGDSVEQVRQRYRELQQALTESEGATQDITREADPPVVATKEAESSVNGIYRVMKNNKIMSQVLRNKHGRLEKTKIEEIIAIIADSGLRLIKLVLESEERVIRLALLLHEQNKDWDSEELKRALEYVSFVWMITNIEDIVSATSVSEIKESVQIVVERSQTPAYELIGYFNQLEIAERMTERNRNTLRVLLRKHNDPFIARMLSIRTQHYMNTHHSPAPIEQSVCSLLKIDYVHRLRSEP